MSPLSRFSLSCVLVSSLLSPALLAAAKAKTPPGTAAAKESPAAAAAAAKEELPTIPGVEVARADGTWLGLRVENNVFVLSFYNAKKQPIAPDAARATARWNPSQKIGSALSVLTLNVETLVGNKPVTPPRIFKVFLTLLKEDGTAFENHAVDYRDPS